MKKRICGKSAALLMAAAMMMSMGLAGCGKKSVDYDMDEENGGSSGGKLASRLDVPDSYEGTLEGISEDTGLTEVTIKASSITVPDTDKMSVNYYTLKQYDSEYKQRVCESFFDKSAGIYIYDWDKPYKEDVEKSIEMYQKLADEAETDDDRSWYEEMVTSYQEQLKTASTEREGAGDYSADTYVGYVGEYMYMISFTSAETGGTGNFSIDYYPSDSLIDYKPMDGATNVYCYSSDYAYEEDDDETDTTNQASLSTDDAVQKGLEFLASCGITDVSETKVTDLQWEYTDSSYNTVATERNGYVVTFTRSIDGIAPYTAYMYNVDPLNSSDSDVWYDSVEETFEMNIDDNGIISAYCYDILDATGDKDENVDLISWDKALEKLPDAINTFYTANKTSYSTIEFNDVRLAYYKMKDGDTYKYAPVWVFAQCDESADSTDGSLDTSYPIQVVMLDATTGDVIDLTQVLDSESYGETIDGDSVVTVDEDGNIIEESTDEEVDETDESGDEDTIDETDESEDGSVIDESSDDSATDETAESGDDSSVDDTAASIDDASVDESEE